MLFSWEILFNVIGWGYLTSFLLALIITGIETKSIYKEHKIIQYGGKTEELLFNILANKKHEFSFHRRVKTDLEIYINRQFSEEFYHCRNLHIKGYPKCSMIFNYSGSIFPYIVYTANYDFNIPWYCDGLIKKINLKLKRLTNPKKKIG